MTNCCYLSGKPNVTAMKDQCTYTLDVPKTAVLPSFIFSHTLQGRIREPRWVSPAEAVAALEKAGVKTSKQTLFNMEKRGLLSTERISPRVVRFDLNELLERFMQS